MTKRYTISFTKTQTGFATVGNEFFDHGRRMMITSVGEPYLDGNRKAFDIEAVELPTAVKSRPPTRRPRRVPSAAAMERLADAALQRAPREGEQDEGEDYSSELASGAAFGEAPDLRSKRFDDRVKQPRAENEAVLPENDPFHSDNWHTVDQVKQQLDKGLYDGGLLAQPTRLRTASAQLSGGKFDRCGIFTREAGAASLRDSWKPSWSAHDRLGSARR